MSIDLDMTPLRVTSCLEIGEGWMGSGLKTVIGDINGADKCAHRLMI